MDKYNIKPEIGLPVTWTIWTDCHAGRIIEVSPSGKKVRCEFDNAGDRSFTLRKNGRWKGVGSKMNEHGDYLALGYAREYYDPSF